MTKNEFVDYVDGLLSSKETFFNLSREDQEGKNKRRSGKKKWEKEKIEQAVEESWKILLSNIYEKVQELVGSRSLRDKWIEFINKDDFLESIDQSISEIEFD